MAMRSYGEHFEGLWLVLRVFEVQRMDHIEGFIVQKMDIVGLLKDELKIFWVSSGVGVPISQNNVFNSYA